MKNGLILNKARGQISVEYLLIFALVVMLVISGNPNPLQQFFEAIKLAYQNFTFAISAP